MQQTIPIRSVRRSFSIKVWASEKNEILSRWLQADSQTFTALCGEHFTRSEVLLVHLYAVGIAAACIVASWLEGGML